MNSLKIACSIVAFRNDPEELKKAINSFIDYKRDTKLYLIDNSPTNDLEKYFKHPKIEYFFVNANIGYGAGHNIAIRKSMQSNVDYHLVLNPDVVFNTEILDELIEFMDSNAAIGNLMPKVLYPNGKIQYLCKLLPTPYDWIGRRFNPFKGIVKNRNQLFELQFSGYNKMMEVPYLSGCFMFLRVDSLRNIGLFDENIFMYGEETDLCRRLIAGGYKTIFYPEVSIVHEFQKGSHKSWRLTWIGIKSAIYYFNKWGWFFDKERSKINKETLQNLEYKK